MDKQKLIKKNEFASFSIWESQKNCDLKKNLEFD